MVFNTFQAYLILHYQKMNFSKISHKKYSSIRIILLWGWINLCYSPPPLKNSLLGNIIELYFCRMCGITQTNIKLLYWRYTIANLYVIGTLIRVKLNILYMAPFLFDVQTAIFPYIQLLMFLRGGNQWCSIRMKTWLYYK